MRSDPKRVAVGLLVPLVMAGCGNGPSAPEVIELERPLTVSEAAVLSASNAFAFRLLEQVRADEPAAANVFLSPLSVSMALGMAANGAASSTLDGMRSALGVADLSREEMNAAYRGLLDLLPGLDPAVQVGIANSAWSRQETPFHPAFLERVRQSFDAEVRALDFDDPGAKDVINAWVRANTEGRIETIVQEIRREDVLFLINATYFKGTWTTRFDPGETRPEAFRLEEGSSVTVPTMRGERVGGRFLFGSDVAVADLPFGGQAYSLTLVVPREGSLSELLDGLTGQRWEGWMAGARPDTVPVRLPRFELEFEAELKDALSRMGMAEAFTDAADFSDMTPLDVLISRVKHKTFLSVDEEGAEAAAATSVGIGVTSVPLAFAADRPFLVGIRERLTGTLLFLGAVYDPR